MTVVLKHSQFSTPSPLQSCNAWIFSLLRIMSGHIHKPSVPFCSTEPDAVHPLTHHSHTRKAYSQTKKTEEPVFPGSSVAPCERGLFHITPPPASHTRSKRPSTLQRRAVWSHSLSSALWRTQNLNSKTRSSVVLGCLTCRLSCVLKGIYKRLCLYHCIY